MPWDISDIRGGKIITVSEVIVDTIGAIVETVGTVRVMTLGGSVVTKPDVKLSTLGETLGESDLLFAEVTSAADESEARVEP